MYDRCKSMPNIKCPCCRDRIPDLPNKIKSTGILQLSKSIQQKLQKAML